MSSHVLNQKLKLQFFFPFFILFLIGSCNSGSNERDQTSAITVQYLNKKLTDVIIENIFTPPVSSRIYAYSNIAAYECLRHADPVKYISFEKRLNKLDSIPTFNGDEINYSISSVVAFSIVGDRLSSVKDRMNPKESHLLIEMRDQYLSDLQENTEPKVLENSISFGNKMADHILSYAKNDGYNSRKYPIYVVHDEPGNWVPTPPAFMPAIEPNWKTLRTFVLDSVGQFNKELNNTQFDTSKVSKFYNEALEVYEKVDFSDSNKVAIAKFWDCNPNIISGYVGNLKLFYQKISPGGHWVHIACDATASQNVSQAAASEIIAITAISIADGFISCWDLKYETNLVRPETYIRSHIDSKWEPILETPPFPEHTSGHSVVSGAASVVLTKMLGSNFSFTDSTEVRFGLPSRTFSSFYEASSEAAISRLYGGIHYAPAIDLGLKQGKEIGDFISNKLIERKN